MIDLFMVRDRMEEYFARKQCQWAPLSSCYNPGYYPADVEDGETTERDRRRETDQTESSPRFDGRHLVGSFVEGVIHVDRSVNWLTSDSSLSIPLSLPCSPSLVPVRKFFRESLGETSLFGSYILKSTVKSAHGVKIREIVCEIFGRNPRFSVCVIASVLEGRSSDRSRIRYRSFEKSVGIVAIAR